MGLTAPPGGEGSVSNLPVAKVGNASKARISMNRGAFRTAQRLLRSEDEVKEIMKIDPLPEPMLDRREFTLAAILAMLSGVTITISGCGGGSSSPTTPNPTPPPPAAGDKSAAISANHGHTCTITAAQLTAGGDVTLQLTEGSGHTHSCSLTGAEVVQVRDNTRVSKESSSNSGHTHTVTFN